MERAPGRARRPRPRPGRHGDPLRPLRPAGAWSSPASRAGPGTTRATAWSARSRRPIDAGRGQALLRRLLRPRQPGPTGPAARGAGPAAPGATSPGSSTRSRRTSAPTAPAPATRSSPAARWAPTTRSSSRSPAPTCSRSRSASRATTTRRPGTAGATAATRRTSPTPPTTSPHLHGDHLDWLRSRLHVVLTVGRGRLGDPPDRLAAERAADGPAARREADLPRARRLGPRRPPTTGPGGEADRAPPPAVLLSVARSAMATDEDHLIGLLLGAEEDWPQAFEAILRRVGPARRSTAPRTRSRSERLTIEPFDLTDPVRTELVIDRLAYWYYHPREWLKKAALVNGTYLLNSPFTFQSMEKHSAYCAMLRLGLKVPETILVPYKNPVDNVRWAYTAREVQPALRPRRDRRRARLPALHEAVRRRRLARRLADQRPRRPAPGLRRVRRDADAPPGDRRATSTSPAPCRSAPRRW